MLAKETSLEERILERFKPSNPFSYPPTVVLNDLRGLGFEREIRHVVAALLRRKTIRFLRTVPGVWWRPAWCPFANVPLHPTNGMLARAVARKFGERPVVAVREAEGMFGLAERYDEPGAPGLVAVPGIEAPRRYGVRGDRTIVVAEPVPRWIANLESDIVQGIVQAFRKHLDLDRVHLMQLARRSARRARPKAFLDAVVPQLSNLPAPYDDIARAMCEELETVRRRKAVLADRAAPADWRPPEAGWSGPIVTGEWRIEEFEEDGIRRERLTGGHLQRHPYLLAPSPWWHSSPLVWVDLRRGWAQTSSRLYRLFGRGASEDEPDGA